MDHYQVARTFNGAAVAIGRELRKLSQLELARLINVSASAISQLESGGFLPAPETVLAISHTLGFAPRFFASESRFEKPGVCQFRRRLSIAALNRHQLAAYAAVVARLISLARRIGPISGPADLPDPSECPDSPAEAAKLLRATWGLADNPAPDLVHTVERHGLFAVPLRSRDAVDGLVLRFDGTAALVLNYLHRQASYIQFTIAHELGHLLLRRTGTTADESQADTFAAEFLLPAGRFEAECPRRLVWEQYIALKRRWNVSLADILRRAKNLGIITTPTYYRAFSQLNQKEWRQQEPAEPRLVSPSAYRQLLASAYRTRGIADFAEEVGVTIGDLHNLSDGNLALLSSLASPPPPQPVESQQYEQLGLFAHPLFEFRPDIRVN